MRLCAILALFVFFHTAHAQSDTVLFDTEFDFVPETLRFTAGQVRLNNGVLHLTSDTNAYILLESGANWANYTIDVRLRIRQGRVWLQGRSGDDGCTGYYLALETHRDAINLASADETCQFTIHRTLRQSIPRDTWLTVRLAMDGHDISGRLDERLQVQDRAYSGGYPRLNILPVDGHADIEIDYLRVTTAYRGDANAPAPATNDATTLPPLTAYDAAPGDAIRELESLGLVPPSGRMRYATDLREIARIGSWYDAFPIGDDLRNIAIGGTLRFFPTTGGIETCFISLHVTAGEFGKALPAYLDIGIDPNGTLFVNDVPQAGQPPAVTLALPLNLTPNAPHTFTIIAADERLTVFIDGEGVIERQAILRRSGGAGLALESETSSTVCELRNLWVYGFDG